MGIPNAGKVKVSIIIAVYNGGKTLQRCIDSIANQTYPNIELIIIDGASTDATVDIIKNNEEHITYWKSEPDKGIADAWNKALKRMRGDWFLILGADDFLVNNKVCEDFVKHLAEPVNSLIVYGEVNRVRSNGDIIESNDGARWDLKRFLERPMYCCHQSILCHRSLVDEIGLFDVSLRTAMDYDFILRAVKHTTPIYIEGFIIANFTMGGVSGSCDDILKMYREISEIKRKQGYGNFQLYYVFLVSKAVVKFIVQKIMGDKIRRKVVNMYRLITGRKNL